MAPACLEAPGFLGLKEQLASPALLDLSVDLEALDSKALLDHLDQPAHEVFLEDLVDAASLAPLERLVRNNARHAV